MHDKIPKLKSFMIGIIILLVCIDFRISFAGQYDTKPTDNSESKHLRCLQNMVKSIVDMLIATRGVIAKNQELINRDPISGNYYFKGFVPALVGTEIANDFSLITGYKLKQTSLKLRDPSNAPDEWEKEVLKRFELPDYPKGDGYGEILVIDDKKVYKYIKPVYVERACLDCHGEKKDIKPEIRQFLERKYPRDQAFEYKEGDVRGGISIVIPIGDLNLQ